MESVLQAMTGLIPPIDAAMLTLGVLFVSVLVTVVASVALLGPRDAVQRRLEESIRPEALEPLSVQLRQATEAETSVLGRFITPQDEAERSRMRLHLVQAGYRSSSALRSYYLIRALLGLGLPLLVVVTYLVASLGAEPQEPGTEGGLPAGVWVLPLLVAAGFYGPILWIRHRIHARQNAIRAGFPDALDMLLVSVEAGLGLDAATARVAAEIRPAHPIIADEFAIAGFEVRAGKSRHAVLRDMAERIGVDEVSSLVTVLNQSHRFGTSVADALRVYAADMRSQRMLRAEEKANKLPVKLSIAVVLCMLPAMFSVILGPTVIKVIRILLPAGGGS